MKISGAWMERPGTQALFRALAEAGFLALFVGGCVRNALLELAVSDVDIATDALPQTVTNIAEKAGFKVAPTGIDHGTVTVLVDGVGHEVTTFRHDVKTDGRRAAVVFAAEVREDAARRDFTMNALYATASGEVIDPLNGLADLMARRVRFVGNPDQRIREDYLRILRFFRFQAVYGAVDTGVDEEGLAACAAGVDGLHRLSRERIGSEMRKLLDARDPAPAVGCMAAAGVLQAVLPGSDPRFLAPLVHLEGAVRPRWQRRLAVLGGGNLTSQLRLSRADAAAITTILNEMGSGLSAAALGWKLGALLATDVVLCQSSVLGVPLPQSWRDEIARGAQSKLPVTAADLCPPLEGRALGQELRRIEMRWLASDLTLSRAELLGHTTPPKEGA